MIPEVVLRAILKSYASKGYAEVREIAEVLELEEEDVESAASLYGLEIERGRVILEDPISLVLELGARGHSVEDLMLALGWRDLEALCSKILELEGFATLRNFRFSSAGRRHEIDVVGLRKPYVVLVECKRWKRVPRSKIEEAVERHVERVRALARSIDGTRLYPLVLHWGKALLAPVIATLLQGELLVHGGVPIAPVYKLAGLLRELDSYADSLALFEFTARSLL